MHFLKGHIYGYKTSKAALRMATRILSLELEQDNILVFPLHPGWVQTDMGGSLAPLTVEESAKKMMQTLKDITQKQQGHFMSFDNTEIPW